MRGALLATALLLGGCSGTGDLAGAITGTAAAAGTANPALGAAVGIGTRAVVDYAWRIATRRWHTTEQQALAATVGEMAPGEIRGWEARHTLSIGTQRGLVRLVRAMETPLATCKEALFSVERGGTDLPRWYLVQVCQQGAGWAWANAEPATQRWTSLQ